MKIAIRATDLSAEMLVAVAHGLGLYRWRDRAHLEELVESWPGMEAFMTAVDPRVHRGERMYPGRDPHWTDRAECSYCGSMTVSRATALLKTPGASFSGTDQKYGYPHKFYLEMNGEIEEGRKFYTRHLYDATPAEIEAWNTVCMRCFGVQWFVSETGLGYRQPRTHVLCGWQTFGHIGPDGEPVFHDGSPRPPPASFFITDRPPPPND